MSILNRLAIATLAIGAHSALAAPLNLGNSPLYLSSSVPPLVMLTVSKDHTLYNKAYNDYSDLDGDLVPETTYKHGIDYAGYFDSYKCYNYDTTNKYFYPVNYSAKRRTVPDGDPINLAKKYCNSGVGTVTVSNATIPSGAKATGTWSGNFLNWASMARIDVMRLVLYGGTRSTDATVALNAAQALGGNLLERTYLPNDAHSWAKYYNGSDIANLTPFAPATTAPTGTSTSSNTTPGNVSFAAPGFSYNKGDSITVKCLLPTSGTPAVPTVTARLTGLATSSGGANPIKIAVFAMSGNISAANTCTQWNLHNNTQATTDKTSATVLSFPTFPTSLVYSTAMTNIRVGDQLQFVDTGNANNSVTGTVTSISSGNVTIFMGLGDYGPESGQASSSSWNITNLSRTGISFCNTTINNTSGATYSQQVVTTSSPPLIRVVQGNYALWSANERWQCRYYEEKSNTNGGNTGYANSNGNRAAQSQLASSAENPSNVCSPGTTTQGVATGLCTGSSPDYVARVAACVGVQSGNNLNGEERCKQYTNGNYKPVGLLQTYGDGNLIQFGLMTGSYDHNVSGGIVRKNITSFQNEVNYTTDGTFTAASASGIVGNMDKMRLYGYNHGSGVYNDSSPSGEGCTFQLIEIVPSGGDGSNTVNEGNCGSWGNPMSEMYLEALRYFAGKAGTTTGSTTSGSTTVTVASTANMTIGMPISGPGIPAGATVTAVGAGNVTISAAATATGSGVTFTMAGDPRFQGRGNNSTSKDVTLGLTTNTAWSDPLSVANYCAPLNVMMFNPAISSYDDLNPDQMDKFSDIVTTSPAPSAPFNQTMDQLTKAIGDTEGITGNTFFIGNAPGAPAGSQDTCVPKAVSDLSQINGMCPEGPGINGSYRMAGAAWYARMNRIRTPFTGGSTGVAPPASDVRALKVATYGVQLATNTPKMVVPVPGSSPAQTVTIQPTYRLDKGSGRFGGGTLVDFKIVAQDLTAGTGTFYVNYEDSGQGGDYDQDIWGRLSYCIKTASTTCPKTPSGDTPANGTITITQDIIAESTVLPQGWGFIISGTTQDGMHFFSGIGDTATSGLNYASTTVDPAAGTSSAEQQANQGLRNLAFTSSTATGTITVPTNQIPVDSTGVLGCSNCQLGDEARAWIFRLSTTSNAGILRDPLYYAAKWGGFTDQNGNNIPDQSTEFDIANSTGGTGSDGTPDNYYFVTNPLALQQSLDRAFIAILTTSSASSVATNTTQLRAGAAVYQASFNSNDWSGELASLAIDLAGNVNQSVPLWTASPKLSGPTAFDFNTRTVITYNPNPAFGPVDGTPFRYCALGAVSCSGVNDPTLRNFLNTDGGSGSADGLPTDPVCNTVQTPAGCVLKGRSRVNYIRGDATYEGTSSATPYRVRPNTKLGDIINSTPMFVGAPSQVYFDTSYIQFRAANLTRKPMIYVGGNDGMLHGFDASSDPTTGAATSTSGTELLAYIPGSVYRNLTKLTGQTYNGSGNHRYFVDGNPAVGDAFIDPTSGGAGTQSWQTVLVGGLNAGGKGLYALNVTDPSSYSEANAANIVLWEFSNANDPDLGFTFSTPIIAKMANGKWAVIVGNGYNNSQAFSGEVACTGRTSLYVQTPAGCTSSSDGHSSLFIIFIENGTDGVWTPGVDYVKIDTGSGTVGTPVGLSSPFAMDVDGDSVVDFVYAGDLQGNMWKFDLTDTSPGNWHVSLSGVPLFTAQDASGNRQPIQDSPAVTIHPNGGQMVLFGTGKYLEPGDDVASISQPYRTQSFYGLWDREIKTIQNGVTIVGGGSAISGRSVLMSQFVYCSGTLGTASTGGTLSFLDPTKTCSIQVVGGTPLITNQFRLTSQHQPNYGGSPRSDTVVDPAVNATSPGPAATPVQPQRGWYLDFPNSADTCTPQPGCGTTYSNSGTGERVKDHPFLSTGKLVFATLIPSAIACELGGSGFVFDLDPITGGRLGATPIDVDGNGTLNAGDLLNWNGNDTPVSASRNPTSGIPTVPTVIAGASVASGASSSTSTSSGLGGSSSSGGLGGSSSSSSGSTSSSSSSGGTPPTCPPSTPCPCTSGCEIKVISTSSKQVITIRERGGTTRTGARLSWRELIQD